MRAGINLVWALAAAMTTSGCGVSIPHMGDIGVSRDQRIANERDLVSHIQCELHLAVQRVRDEDAESRREAEARHLPVGNSLSWLDSWGAKVTLDFQVEAKSTINPNLSITNPLEDAVKTFADGGKVTVHRNHFAKIGATLTSDITRTESISYFYPIQSFVAARRLEEPPAANGSPRPIKVDDICEKTNFTPDDDLQFYDWLKSKVKLARLPGLLGQKPEDSPFLTLSYEAKFVITKGVSGTPGLTLATVAVEPTGDFYNGSRVKSDHILITLGAPSPTNKSLPSNEVDQQHLARLFGDAVVSALRRN